MSHPDASAAPMDATGVYEAPLSMEAIIARLEAHRTLGSVPREELAWLAAHGRIRRFAPGDWLAADKEVVEGLYVILEGHFAIHVDRGAGRHKVMEWHGGDVSGLIPYSRMVRSPGDVLVEEATEILMVRREHFRELTVQCPVVTGKLVHVMLDRARIFNSSDLRDEKMLSLGKLSAGLAHELNNPASAAARAAKLLGSYLAEADTAARTLGAAQLDAAQLAVIDRVRDACLAKPRTAILTPLERADREDAMADWLVAHGADPGSAAALADTPVSFESLDDLARALPAETLEATIRWIAAGCTTRAIAHDIEHAATRIYQLVKAVKGFTYMDRPSVPEPVDVAQGLSDTIALLAAKARAKSASVQVEVPEDLPRVRGFGAELNQVWLNLIDNAIDAVSEGGRVVASADLAFGRVTVRIVDDGPGIPDHIRTRIFDPFFTTKPVGQGSGLGLDVARNIMRHHDGTIEVDSRPGRTEFRVTLPVADAGATGDGSGPRPPG